MAGRWHSTEASTSPVAASCTAHSSWVAARLVFFAGDHFASTWPGAVDVTTPLPLSVPLGATFRLNQPPRTQNSRAPPTSSPSTVCPCTSVSCLQAVHPLGYFSLSAASSDTSPVTGSTRVLLAFASLITMSGPSVWTSGAPDHGTSTRCRLPFVTSYRSSAMKVLDGDRPSPTFPYDQVRKYCRSPLVTVASLG